LAKKFQNFAKILIFCSAGRTPLGFQLALNSPKCSG
jgi:hypothetical protein